MQFHDLSMDPMVRNMQCFAKRSMNNVRNRTLHHHVFDTDLVVQMVTIAEFKVLFAGTHRFHIIVLCQKLSAETKVGERGTGSSSGHDSSAIEQSDPEWVSSSVPPLGCPSCSSYASGYAERARTPQKEAVSRCNSCVERGVCSAA